jgi:hypothetical protein
LFNMTLEAQDRTITFSKINQKEIVKAGENISIAYDGIGPESVYLSYEAGFDGGYIIELKPNPLSMISDEQMKNLIKTKSIIFSCGDDSPIMSSERIISPDREITFAKIGDTVNVYPCQKVNINYAKSFNIEDVYILYQSQDWGYILELSKKSDFKQIKLDKLCMVMYTANPNLATIVVPFNLRYEQIIWTPMSNGYWELRLGNVNRGCKSRGLSGIGILRTPEYEKQVTIDKSNYTK